jgi:hypothetical protein
METKPKKGAGAAPGERRGGRKKGTPNKRSWDCVRALERLGFDPAAKLVQLTLDAEADYRTLRKMRDFENAAPFLATASANCAKLMKFVYPERKAVDVTSDGEKIASLADLFASVISEQSSDKSDES